MPTSKKDLNLDRGILIKFAVLPMTALCVAALAVVLHFYFYMHFDKVPALASPEVREALGNIRRDILMSLLPFAVAMFCLTMHFARVLLEPVFSVAKVLERTSHGYVSARVHLKPGADWANLSWCLNAALDRIQMRHEEKFIEIAHPGLARSMETVARERTKRDREGSAAGIETVCGNGKTAAALF